MRVKRASKYGFCAGVRVADLKVRRFAAVGERAAILGQVVHNERVVEEMEALGMRTVDAIEEVSEPTVVFSAHGVPASFHERARELGLEVLDTTCTFVYDIHDEVRTALAEGCHLVIVGDPEHREVVGYTHDLGPDAYHVVSTMEDVRFIDWGSYPKIKVIFQTTLNADDATRENQEAARELAEDPEVEVVLVIGGKRSANSKHLWEITSRNKTSYLIQSPEDILREWFEGVSCIGLTAGASTPDTLIDEVQEYLEKLKTQN
jgi:4-hydroxy-3-methylbut-2-enyl diphosphate reductase